MLKTRNRLQQQQQLPKDARRKEFWKKWTKTKFSSCFFKTWAGSGGTRYDCARWGFWSASWLRWTTWEQFIWPSLRNLTASQGKITAQITVLNNICSGARWNLDFKWPLNSLFSQGVNKNSSFPSKCEEGLDLDNCDYDTSIMSRTVVSDFGLICDRLPMLPVVASSYMAGVMVFNFIAG